MYLFHPIIVAYAFILESLCEVYLTECVMTKVIIALSPVIQAARAGGLHHTFFRVVFSDWGSERPFL